MFRLLPLLLLSACVTTTQVTGIATADASIPVVLFNSPVNRDSVREAAAELLQQKSSNHYMYINSPGGDLDAAKSLTKIFSLLHKKGDKLVCFAGPMVASAAYFLYLHCDTRYALPDSVLFPHRIHIWFPEPMLPEILVQVGVLTIREQMQWDKEGMEITGMSEEDYTQFRDSDDAYWTIPEILAKSKKKWFTVLPYYNFLVK